MMGWLWRAADSLRHRLRLKRIAPHLAWGARGEDLAHRYLQSQGLKVVSRNWRRPGRRQEIDIVALDRGRLVIVEVKSRHDTLFAPPDRNVDFSKRLNTARAALDFAAPVPRRRRADPLRSRHCRLRTLLNRAHPGCLEPEILRPRLICSWKLARSSQRPHYRPLGDCLHRPRTPPERLRPATGGDQGRSVLPLLSRQRNKNAARGPRLSPFRLAQ